MIVRASFSLLLPVTMIATFAAVPAVTLAGASTHIGIAVTGGLSGFGADLGVNINDYLGVRGTVDGFSIDRNGEYGTSATWDANLKLFQAGLLLDIYPFRGTFHLTGGIVDDGNKLSMTGRPTGETFTFNGNQYPANDIGSASANVDWNKSVPYVGVGWGNLAGSRGFHFTTDLGVLFTGSPRSRIAVTCSATGQADGICAQLDNDVAAERIKLQKDVHNITFWPVLRLGFGYAF